MTNYYSTQPFLAWAISRVFFKKHHVYLAEAFLTYRLPNPKSSDPYHIYFDFYAPWRDRDSHDKFIRHTRVNLRKAIRAQQYDGTISPTTSKRLQTVCRDINIEFFYPIVYRVDLDHIPSWRRKPAGSGLAGSHEVLVEDLQDSEFDVLLLDHAGTVDFEALKVANIQDASALTHLENAC